MKWFKHDTTALSDPKIKRLMLKYGIEGYGVYFAVLERIAFNVSAGKREYRLEDDIDILAHDFKIEEEKLKDILRLTIELGLLTVTDKKITCFKLADRLDEYMKKVKARTIKNKSEHVLALVEWHKEQVEQALGKFTTQMDMDAWYIGIDDILKSGIAIEDVQDVVRLALNDKFWKDKVIHGGKLRDNFDKIRLSIGKTTKANRESKYDEVGL